MSVFQTFAVNRNYKVDFFQQLLNESTSFTESLGHPDAHFFFSFKTNIAKLWKLFKQIQEIERLTNIITVSLLIGEWKLCLCTHFNIINSPSQFSFYILILILNVLLYSHKDSFSQIARLRSSKLQGLISSDLSYRGNKPSANVNAEILKYKKPFRTLILMIRVHKRHIL